MVKAKQAIAIMGNHEYRFDGETTLDQDKFVYV